MNTLLEGQPAEWMLGITSCDHPNMTLSSVACSVGHQISPFLVLRVAGASQLASGRR